MACSTASLADIAQRYSPDPGDAALLTEQVRERLAWRLRHSGKACRKCEEVQPLASFTRDTQRPDGLSLWCKPCHRKWRAARK